MDEEKEIKTSEEETSKVEEKPVENIEDNPTSEAKPEVVNEDNKTEEAPKKDEKPEPLNDKKEIQEHFEYEDPSLEQIEKNRQEFLKFYKRQNVVKWIVGLVALALVIGAWIGLPNIGIDSEGKQAAWVLPVMISTVVVVMLAVFAYTFWTRRVVKRQMRVYFTNYYNESNKYVFSQDGFEEHTLQNPDKIEKIQFDENLLYYNVESIGSRCTTEFKYHGDLMMVCDCAAQVKTDKRLLPVFVGKYMVAPAAYDEAEPIFIYIKGDHRALPPTNLQNVKAVLDDKFMIIYSNNDKWAKTINAKVTKALKAIKTGDQLVDVAISINKGKVYFCVGYDDPVMVLPLEHAFDPTPIMEYKKEIALFCKVAEELSK